MSRSILAPLTTTFTPPPACSTFGASGGLSATEFYWQGQSCSGGYPHDDARCWPPALVSTPSPNLFGFGFYSPGLICPSGYYSACTGAMLANGSPSPLNIGTTFPFQFSLTAGETAIGCCPPGLTCSYRTGDGVQTCATTITTGKVPNVVGFCPTDSTDYYTGRSIDVGVPYVDGGNNKTTMTLSTAELFAPLIQIVFKSTDISSLPSPTTPPTTSTPSQAAATSSGVYGNTSGATASSGDGGLSTGAKIGIGVGVPLAVLLVAGLAAFILFRRRKARRTHAPIPASAFPNAAEKPADAYGQERYPPQQQHQGQYVPVATDDNKWRNTHEAPDSQRGVELSALPEQRPVELPGSGHGGSRY